MIAADYCQSVESVALLLEGGASAVGVGTGGKGADRLVYGEVEGEVEGEIIPPPRAEITSLLATARAQEEKEESKRYASKLVRDLAYCVGLLSPPLLSLAQVKNS